MQISKMESHALEVLQKNKLALFTTQDICLLLRLKRAAVYNLIKALKKKGLVSKSGQHFLLTKETSELELASQLHYPSYISFWSALNYYGFSDQNPHVIFIATTRYKKSSSHYCYVTLAKEKYFGYTSIGNITIADKEKALIDSLLFPKYAGGIREIERSLKAALDEAKRKAEELSLFNASKLVAYALRIKNKALRRRLGFLLEAQGYKNKKVLAQLQKQKGSGYERLDPALPRKNKLNKRWLLDINT